VAHIIYVFDLIPDIYGLDWIGLDEHPYWIGLGQQKRPTLLQSVYKMSIHHRRRHTVTHFIHTNLQP